MKSEFSDNNKEELYDMANKMGIKIVNAKSPKDSKREAIHILNPVLEDLEGAIFEAERKQHSMIVIHNKQTWGFKTAQEKVEINQKLLA